MYRLTPREELRGRLAAFREGLAKAELDAAVVAQNADLFYLSGSIQQGLLVVPAAGEPVYFVRRVYERAVEESAVGTIERIGGLRDVPEYFARKGIAFGSVGFELDVLPVQTFQRYSALFPGARTADVSPIIRQLRAVKGPAEIAAMRACGEKLGGLLAAAAAAIREGMTETELQGLLQGRAIGAGHTTICRMRAWNQEVGLGCVISGDEAAVPSYADFPTAGRGSSPYVPAGHGRRAFGRSEPIIVDLMWACDGYLVDMARTYVVGTLPGRMASAYEGAVGVMRAIEEGIRPGASAGDLYEAGVATAAETPFAANFMGAPGYNVKFIGHGIGIEVDEFPFIAKGSKTVLAPGMTFALEPKFVFPGEGAVGLENSYLVTETGFEKLTRLNEGIIHCGP